MKSNERFCSKCKVLIPEKLVNVPADLVCTDGTRCTIDEFITNCINGHPNIVQVVVGS